MQNWAFPSLQGQDGMHPRVLRKLTNVTVIRISSSKDHSSQAKYPGSNLFFTGEEVSNQPDSEMVDSKGEGRAKTLLKDSFKIYHKFREFLAIYHSVLLILNHLNDSYRKNRDHLISEIHSKRLRWKKHKLQQIKF